MAFDNLNLKDTYGSGQDNLTNPVMYDEKGMELILHMLFGKDEPVYAALFGQLFGDDGLGHAMYVDRMARAHANRGVGTPFSRTSATADFAGLLKG